MANDRIGPVLGALVLVGLLALALIPSATAIDVDLDYSGVGACAAGNYVTAANADTAPTCGGLSGTSACTGLSCSGNIDTTSTGNLRATGTGGLSIADGNAIIEDTTGAANSASTILSLKSRYSSSPTSAGHGAALYFYGEDAGNAEELAASLEGVLSDVTAGGEAGSLDFRIKRDDSLFSRVMRLSGSGALVVGGTAPLRTEALSVQDVGLGSGGLHVQSAEAANSVAGISLSGGSSGNPSIEMRGSGGAVVPYIDFSNDTSIDFDGRLILDSDDVLKLDGATLEFTSTTEQPKRLGLENLVQAAIYFTTTASSCTVSRGFNATGASCARNGTGNYTVTYGVALAGAGNNYITTFGAVGGECCPYVIGQNAASLQVGVNTCSSGAAVDGCGIMFVNVGP